MKITGNISHDSVKIYVNNIPHIHFIRSRFVGFLSWQFEHEGREGQDGMYYIEITLEGGNILLSYDRQDMWLAILAELEKSR